MITYVISAEFLADFDAFIVAFSHDLVTDIPEDYVLHLDTATFEMFDRLMGECIYEFMSN